MSGWLYMSEYSVLVGVLVKRVFLCLMIAVSLFGA